MHYLDKIIAFLLPTSLIISPSQLKKYNIRERQNFRSIAMTFLPIVAITYILHYYFFDIPMKLEPQNLWFNYRFSMAAFAMGIFLFYWRFRSLKFLSYKFPMILFLTVCCYLQTQTILWWDQVPYLYSFIFMVISCVVLGLTPLNTILYTAFLYSIQHPTLLASGLETHHLASALMVTVIFSSVLSSIRYFQVKVFVSNQNLIEEQQKNIEQNLEFTKTLKSFLPKKIARNLDERMISNRMGLYQAVDEILRPKKRNISCLSCDIRGYTEKSKNISYIANSVIPLTQSESQVVENHEGIPRKIGDLLFCYFDDIDLVSNVKNALLAAMEISLKENSHNKEKELSEQIRKQIIVNIGEAYVGNIGGADSAVEITALGTPVNFLNRLEGVIKTPEFLEKIPRDHIVVSGDVFRLIQQMSPDVEFSIYSLNTSSLKIKDFEEVNTFYSLCANESNFERIRQLTPVDFFKTQESA